MPIYEYECSRCAHRFEVRRSFSESSPVSCPQCDCDAQRIFSPVPIIFKGSGFYVTDNRGNHSSSSPTSSNNEVKAGSTDKTETSKTDQSSSSTTENTNS